MRALRMRNPKVAYGSSSARAVVQQGLLPLPDGDRRDTLHALAVDSGDPSFTRTGTTPMTYPRSLLLAACGTVAIAACSPTKVGTSQQAAVSRAPFTSDRISVITREPATMLQGQSADKVADIVLVHGLAAHRDVWSYVANQLEGSYRLHLVQIAGFGGAAPGANADGPVVAPVAEEIARYIGTLRRGSATIVGHSMGGAIGMMVAARHPDLVDHLMVVDEPPSLAVVFGPGMTADSLGKIADMLRSAILNAPPGTLGPFEQMLPGMTRVEAQRPALIQYARASHRPTVANAFRELIVTDLRPELSRITAPTTVLYVVPAALPMSSEAFQQVQQQAFAPIRKVRLVRVDSSEHYIQIDQPGRVVSEVRALMAR
jgi:pimeloyl-ACP methyl ester carboxylesterase